MINFQTLHHANIVLGDIGILNLLKSNLKEAGFETQANPDYFEFVATTFGIDEARELTEWSAGKPIGGEKKVAVIVTSSITHEAQNALLKTLEEPPSDTYFFLVLRNLGGIFGTLLSRVSVLNEFVKQKSTALTATNFAKLSLGQKCAFIKDLAKDEDKEPMRDLIKNLEPLMKNKKILLAKKFASSRGPSPKMLLEWLVASM